ncbi:uracil-DNA glycosylase [soil metagenome]
MKSSFTDLIGIADSSWHAVLLAGLEAIDAADSAYLPALAKEDFLPTEGRMFAAFTQPLEQVRYVLVGEGPYPRAQSATGVCFMDGAVDLLWSEKGLSRQVNRATSLRNFLKMLLVAEGLMDIEETTGEVLARISLKARAIGSPYIQTLAELQDNLSRQGFLLLNAALVFRPEVPPVRDARAWQPFLHTVMRALSDYADSKYMAPPKLVLWGKIAEQLNSSLLTMRFPNAIAEHPYNLSFIGNQSMQALFGPMRLLLKQGARSC